MNSARLNTDSGHRHCTLIKASAGTGKTFDLATHVLSILVRAQLETEAAARVGKASPSKHTRARDIVALTFSRAAASEIFDRVVQRLYRATAPGDDQAIEAETTCLDRALRTAGADANAFRANRSPAARRAILLAILRHFLDETNRSQIGTIDSYLLRMVQLLPEEAGLGHDLTLMEDDQLAAERARIANEILAAPADDSARQLLATALRNAAKGDIERAFGPLLGRCFNNNLLAAFFAQHAQSAWGDPAAIWPHNPPDMEADIQSLLTIPDDADFLKQLKAKVSAAANQFSSCFHGLTEKQATYLDNFLVAVQALDAVPSNDLFSSQPTTELAKNAGSRNFIKAFQSIHDDTPVTVTCGNGKANQLTLEGPALAALRELGRLRLLPIVRRNLRKMQGQYDLMRQFLERYVAETLAEGRLTFNDIPRLIKVLRTVAPDLIRNLEFSLDSSFRHLALDEFQDTSPEQWAAIRELVDEIKQSGPDADRSLFVVGDMKQAIYGWRGGESDLLREESESSAYGVRQSRRYSRRFGPEIARFVNALFDPAALQATFEQPDVPGDKADIAKATRTDFWEKIWEPHDEHKSVDDLGPDAPAPGSVQLLRIAKPEDKNADFDEYVAYADAIANELACSWNTYCKLCDQSAIARTPPPARPRFAILVRKNDAGQNLAWALRNAINARRQAGIILHSDDFPQLLFEGVASIADSPVVDAILELLRLAEHPDARAFAWGRVAATPLPRLALLQPDVRPDTSVNASAPGLAQLSAIVASRLADLGLPGFLEALRQELQALPDGNDPFTAERLEALLQSAIVWTQDTSRDKSLLAFIDFVRSRTSRIIADARSVKLITIHRSKGLTFDQVFVPFFSSKDAYGASGLNHDTLVAAPRENAVTPPRWFLDCPTSLIALPPLGEAYRNRSVRRTLEELCNTYVAMTRATRSLVLLVPEHAGTPRPTHSLYFHDHIARVFEAAGTRPDGTLAFGNPDPALWLSLPDRPPAVSKAAHAVLSPDTVPAANFGLPPPQAMRSNPSGDEPFQQTADHLFSLQPAATERGANVHAVLAKVAWLDPDAPPPAELQAALPPDLLAPGSAFRQALARPADATGLWRERSFELLDADNHWVSGTFDRVVFCGTGPDRRATIYDFKTNTLGPKGLATFEDKLRHAYTPQMTAYRSALAALTGLPLDHIAAILLPTATARPISIF